MEVFLCLMCTWYFTPALVAHFLLLRLRLTVVFTILFFLFLAIFVLVVFLIRSRRSDD